MDKSVKGKKHALMSALCCAANAIYVIVLHFINVHDYPEYFSINVVTIIGWAVNLGFVVVLLMKNKKALLFVAVADSIYNLYWLIDSFQRIYLYPYLICDFLSSVALIIFIILALNNSNLSAKLWYLPAVLVFLGVSISTIIYTFLFDSLSLSFWINRLFNILRAVALIFMGMWIKNELSPVEITQNNEYATFNPLSIGTNQANGNAIGGADRLKIYKELLDTGTISQDEFDQKKKQILGL